MSSSTINLLQRNASTQREISGLEDKLHSYSLWALGILVGAGVIIASLYIYLNSTVNGLETDKANLTRQINQQSDKEGILLSLKDRTAIAGKALGAGRTWGDLFPLLTKIATEGFTSVSADENGRVSTELSLGSVDEASTIVSNIMSLVDDKALRSPQLAAFSIAEDGRIRLSISFIPIF